MKQAIPAIGRRARSTPALSPFESIDRRARSTPALSPFESIAFALSIVLGLGAVGAACSSANGAAPSTALDSGTSAPNDAGAPAQTDDASEDATAPSPQAYLRVAHLVPDAPAIDVCLAPHGTATFQGPLLSQLAASLALDGEGGAAVPGFGYTQVTAYLPLAPGRYDVRIVPAGASSCSASVPLLRPFGDEDGGDGAPARDDAGPSDAGTSDAALVDASTPDAGGSPLDASAPPDAGGDASAPAGVVVGDATNLPPLAFNTHSTLLVAGALHPAGTAQALTFAMVQDDAVLASGAASLRAINAMPQVPSLDFGFGSAATAWLPLLTDVAFGAASAQAGPGYAGVDPNGYLPIAPTASQPLSARLSGSDSGADVAVANDVEIDLGAIASVIAIGGTTGEAASPAALLLCIDNQPSGGLFSDCSVAP